jgi:hypothetical protein
MAKATTSTKVPKARQGLYREVTTFSDRFCLEHLNEEYAELARRAIAALCRKRSCPLLSGRPESWACAVVYALGQINFLSDRASEPCMSMGDLCARFGIAASTGASKAKTVRGLLGMRQWDHRWILPSRWEATGPVWLVEVDGLAVEARQLPRQLQQIAFEKGLIPYVPQGDGQSQRDALLARYRRYRQINTDHQTFLAHRLWSSSVPGIAVRLGLVETCDELAEKELDDMAPALDLALYARDVDSTTEVQRYLAEVRVDLEGDHRAVLEAMSEARFSLFEVLERHPMAGLVLQDILTGEDLWMIDEGLEASAPERCRLWLRIFRPGDFWMTTGAAIVLTGDGMRDTVNRCHPALRNEDLRAEIVDPDGLAEAVYASAVASERRGRAQGKGGDSLKARSERPGRSRIIQLAAEDPEGEPAPGPWA